MSLKYLDVDEMLDLTRTWIDPTHLDRRHLARMASVGGLLPLVDEAHSDLVTATEKMGPRPLRDIASRMMAMDLKHDSYVRVASYGLEMHIHLAIAKGDDHTAKELEQLKGKLLPDGLDLVDYSYREESKQAQELESRLQDDERALLAALPTSDGTLLEAVESWIQCGKKLGEMQEEQDKERKRSETDDRVQAARNKWIRAVKTVRMVLELMGSKRPKVNAILNRVTQLERAAEERMMHHDDEQAAEPS